jgi:hypothetical protein
MRRHSHERIISKVLPDWTPDSSFFFISYSQMGAALLVRPFLLSPFCFQCIPFKLADVQEEPEHRYEDEDQGQSQATAAIVTFRKRTRSCLHVRRGKFGALPDIVIHEFLPEAGWSRAWVSASRAWSSSSLAPLTSIPEDSATPNMVASLMALSNGSNR